jgi:hypothetical protein
LIVSSSGKSANSTWVALKTFSMWSIKPNTKRINISLFVIQICSSL